MPETASATAPPPFVDPQDPLPESQWFWRRLFVFLFAFLAIVGIGWVIVAISNIGESVVDLIGRIAATRDARALDGALDAVLAVINALSRIGFWLAVTLMTLITLYLIAPSAEQATKMLATVSAWKHGVTTASTSRASSPDGSTAEASTSAGIPADPPEVPRDSGEPLTEERSK